jgi:hypothetical protein
MKNLCLATLCAALLFTNPSTLLAQEAGASGGQRALDKLKALEGEWLDADGVFGTKGAMAATYRITSGGKAVVETLAVNSPFEMVTIYHLDGDDLVLTHYCSDGNQPRMRSKGLSGNTLAFDYDGGTNIDVAETRHMHAARIEFVSADEIRSAWTSWSSGKPNSDHSATFRAVRKK